MELILLELARMTGLLTAGLYDVDMAVVQVPDTAAPLPASGGRISEAQRSLLEATEPDLTGDQQNRAESRSPLLTPRSHQ
ncbi:hypothetical protein [Streptomyces shenzhenensis]|uniref:hypothetical protein n=1 Tax=Streptomyces shenzhenensis TaxID=943815 RepID=UPI0033DB5820